MTFSILARCAESGLIGMAVSSSSPAVAARCAHARAGVGAVASQNITDPSLGPRGLDLMASGASAQEALQRLIEAPFAEYRQLGLIDRQGRTAVHSGALSLGIHASAQGRNVICAGNLLANEGVPAAMVAAFETCDGHLGARLLQGRPFGRGGRGAGAFGRSFAGAGPKLALGRPASRLVRGGSNRKALRPLATLPAADGGLRPARLGSAPRAQLRRSRRPVSDPATVPSA